MDIFLPDVQRKVLKSGVAPLPVWHTRFNLQTLPVGMSVATQWAPSFGQKAGGL